MKIPPYTIILAIDGHEQRPDGPRARVRYCYVGGDEIEVEISGDAVADAIARIKQTRREDMPLAPRVH